MRYYKIIMAALLAQSLINVAIAQNQYLNFDGIDDHVQVENNSLINYSADFTLELKFKRERLGTREDLLTKKDLNSSPPSLNDVSFFFSTDDKINILLRESSINQLLLSSLSSIDTTKWYHIACVRTISNVKFYVNGILEASGTMNSDLSSNGPLRIGSNRTESLNPYAIASHAFDGNIDEVRIWSLGRTQTEITNNINSELIGNEPGLAAYYNFNQGTPCSNNVLIDTLIDLTTNHIGALTNFDLTGSLSNPCESNWSGSLETSIKEINTYLTKLYPNPVNTQLKIQFDNGKYIQEIKLYNVTGELLKKITIKHSVSNYQMDLSDLQSGIYFLIISDKNLDQSSYKIMKQ